MAAPRTSVWKPVPWQSEALEALNLYLEKPPNLLFCSTVKKTPELLGSNETKLGFGVRKALMDCDGLSSTQGAGSGKVLGM